MRASVRGFAAAAAMAAMVTGMAGCSSSKGDTTSGKDGKPQGPIVVATEDKAYADRMLQVKGAQFVQVNNLTDPAAKQRVNQALHAPIDWMVAWMGASMEPDQKKQCAGKSSVLKSTVRMGLRGPELLSAATSLELAPCFEADGGFPTQAVTVDLKAGKALTAADVFRPITLTKPGLQKLWSRLSGDKADWKDCPDREPIKRADFFPIKGGAGIPPTPPVLNLLFTPGTLEVFWSEAGSTCNFFKFSAPYAKVKDLLKPAIAAHLG